MEYRLKLPGGDDEVFVEVSRSDFEAAVEAQEGYAAVLHIEEAYDVLAGNYIEFEEVVFGYSIRHLANRPADLQSQDLDEARRSCHRALANLLSSARAFIDQSKSLIGGLPDITLAQVEALFSAEYDARFGYRAMEALRNHAQHHGFTVSGVSLGVRQQYSGMKPIAAAEVSANPYIDVSELRRNPKFNKKVLAELENSVEETSGDGTESIAVLPLVREYVVGLSHALIALRGLLQGHEAIWLLSIIHAKRKYLEPAGVKDLGVLEYQALDAGVLRDDAYLGPWRPEAIEAFRKLNGVVRLTTRSVRQ